MASKYLHGMLTPGDCALALIDYQPAMFSGVGSESLKKTMWVITVIVPPWFNNIDLTIVI